VSCGEEIEISAALQGQIEAQVLRSEHEKHQAELKKVREEAALEAKTLAETATAAANRRAKAEQELLVKDLQEEIAGEREAGKKLRGQLSELMTELRATRQAKENAELEMQKKLTEEEGKIRERAFKEASDKQRLDLAAKDKTISDLQRGLEEAQRKIAQGSQQLQGEILELDLEEALASAFRDDAIMPVAKGVRGGDIKHIVRSPLGTTCGVMLWEIKRTKSWSDGWLDKLKEDLRNEKANIPIIVTQAMPRHISEDMGQLSGVWICKPNLAIILGTLLRKCLLDAARQKALAENRGDKAEALYTFVTSHEFIQQVESMVETYQAMNAQVAKERAAFEKLWAQREKQAEKLLLSTATIIGSMQGHLGQSAVLRIKGLELSDGLELDLRD
jgi:hypothetical protein